MSKQATQKSWRALGVLALALTAGAVRVGEDGKDAQFGMFVAQAPETTEPVPDCTTRAEPAWFDLCPAPNATRVASR